MPIRVHTMSYRYARKCRTCDHIGYGKGLTSNYTCHPCRAKQRPTISVCPQCGETFTPKRSNGGWTKTCSPACNGKSHRRADHDGSPRAKRLAREAIEGLTARQRTKLLHKWRKQQRPCTWCAQGSPETVDHVLPLARGGTNWEGNLLPACRSCNSSRAERLVMEWRLGKPVGNGYARPRLRQPKAPPTPKPLKPRPPCASCGAECQSPRRTYCSDECAYTVFKAYVRNRYRESAGIPLDAPLHESLRTAA